ncbi:hypothetical protein [Cereibacter sphaeroides]|jgi:hypothetical protein|uniref:hypothetical protein n=1 Tax=Cereibacter sphaeroides TaxID=1063 RepID=UPI0005C1BB2D
MCLPLTIRAPSVALSRLRSAFAFRVSAPSFPPAEQVTSGFAPITDPSPRLERLRLLGFMRTALLIERTRRLSLDQHREASTCSAHLRRVNLEILALGRAG